MKLLRTIILFDQGDISKSKDWAEFHSGYEDAIKKMVYPVGSDTLIIRRKTKEVINGKTQTRRNGVDYLKKLFLNNMVSLGWKPEGKVGVTNKDMSVTLKLYPGLQDHSEEIRSKFGGFDFVTHSDNSRAAIEWETGNISSSHRSLNKLCIAIKSNDINIGVLIVPSRDFYTHLTDRIGNISELSPYLSMWKSWGDGINRGLLAISVVEHDELTDDPTIPYLKVGTDGRHMQGQQS